MTQRTLRTPIVVTLLAVAAAGTWFFQYRQDEPTCTASEGEFCIEVNIYPGEIRQQPNYIVVVVDQDVLNNQTQIVRRDPYSVFSRVGENAAAGSDADFESIEAVARINDAPTRMLVAVPYGKYYVCVNDYHVPSDTDPALCVYVDGPDDVAGMNGTYKADLIVGYSEF